jgi:Na+/melibiose symporter-like transporter
MPPSNHGYGMLYVIVILSVFLFTICCYRRYFSRFIVRRHFIKLNRLEVQDEENQKICKEIHDL